MAAVVAAVLVGLLIYVLRGDDNNGNNRGA